MPKLTSYSDTPQRLSFLKGQFTGTIPYPSFSPAHTIIITGANTGLGYSVARQFLEHNSVSCLILACRSLDKADTARKTLLESIPKSNTASPPPEILTWQLDMSSKSSILAFSERCKSLSQIDAVILNAGVDTLVYEVVEGYETTIMVNVVGTMMLATLMVPVLRDVAARNSNRTKQPPRITIVGSAVQFLTNYQFLVDAGAAPILQYLSAEPQWRRNSGEDRYMLSKGILQLAVQRLAAKVSSDIVVVNCAAPGFCKTDLFREKPGLGMKVQMKIMGREADVGARALIVGALGQEGGVASHGRYMSEGLVKKHSSWFDTEQGREIGLRIWREICGEIESVKRDTIDLL